MAQLPQPPSGNVPLLLALLGFVTVGITGVIGFFLAIGVRKQANAARIDPDTATKAAEIIGGIQLLAISAAIGLWLLRSMGFRL